MLDGEMKTKLITAALLLEPQIERKKKHRKTESITRGSSTLSKLHQSGPT